MWGKWLKSISLKAVLKHPTAIAWASVQRVLVIRHRFIGDTVLLEPFLRALRHALPSTAVIDVLVSKGSGELLEGHPAVDELVYFESAKQVLPHLKAKSYDACFVLKRSWSSVLLALKAGIPWRIGFDTEERGGLLTHPIPYRLGVHEAQAFMDALAVLNPASVETEETALKQAILEADWSYLTQAHPLPEDWQALIHRYKASGRRCVLWHAVASNPAKAWPTQAWHAFFDLINNEQGELPPLAFFCIGSPAEKAYYQAFDAHFSTQMPLHIACGELSLAQGMSLLHQLDASFGIDSGPLHMASTAGHPILALFGPTDPQRWKPLSTAWVQVLQAGLPCQPCQLKITCEFEQRCLTHLSPEQVFDAFVRLLNDVDARQGGAIV
jgi:ADP-heptose:LPS heptosyltransferase